MKPTGSSLATRLLVLLSKLCGYWFPADHTRYADDVSYSQWQMEHADKVYGLYEPYCRFAGKRILDLGCGEGGKTVYYATKEVDLIVGIDCEEEKIRKAEGFAERNGVQSICRFLVGDASNTPFPADAFDVVLSEDCFEHYPDPQAVLGEGRRILKPGGLFIIKFQTYYTVRGSHLYNFIQFPWPHVFFPDSAMEAATKVIAAELAGKAASEEEAGFLLARAERDIYEFRNYLNKMKVASWRRMIRRYQGMKVLVADSHCFGARLPFFRLPLLEELSNHMLYVIQKEG